MNAAVAIIAERELHRGAHKGASRLATEEVKDTAYELADKEATALFPETHDYWEDKQTYPRWSEAFNASYAKHFKELYDKVYPKHLTLCLARARAATKGAS